MIVRTVGEVLLGLGFVMLAFAALIRDPTALDANIGAGALVLFGIPLGAVGLLLLILGVVLARVREGRRRPGPVRSQR